MTATARRFRVEVTPSVTAVPVEPAPVPRLTPLAASAGLDGVELDAELASVHRQMASLAAYRAGLVDRKAALGARSPLPFAPGARIDTRPDADVDPSLQAADDFLPDEVAVLLNMSVGSARYLVDDDLTLVRQLPAVWHALADQRIDEARAKVIVRALRHQAESWGGPVGDAVVDDVAARGVEWAAGGCSPTTLRERLDAAVIAADPAAADRRRELRKRGADVTVQGTGDGLADLRTAQLEAADAQLVRAQIDAYARRIKADGDARPIGEIRVGVVVDLITRPWDTVEPATAHLTIDAHLGDLLVPDLGDLADLADLDAVAAEPTDDTRPECGVDDHDHDRRRRGCGCGRRRQPGRARRSAAGVRGRGAVAAATGRRPRAHPPRRRRAGLHDHRPPRAPARRRDPRRTHRRSQGRPWRRTTTSSARVHPHRRPVPVPARP